MCVFVAEALYVVGDEHPLRHKITHRELFIWHDSAIKFPRLVSVWFVLQNELTKSETIINLCIELGLTSGLRAHDSHNKISHGSSLCEQESKRTR